LGPGFVASPDADVDPAAAYTLDRATRWTAQIIVSG
jgi:hypothetical protein